jgi:hypothetical protein
MTKTPKERKYDLEERKANGRALTSVELDTRITDLFVDIALQRNQETHAKRLNIPEIKDYVESLERAHATVRISIERTWHLVFDFNKH